MKLATLCGTATIVLVSTFAVAQTSDGERGNTGWSGAAKDQSSAASPGHPNDASGKPVTVHDEGRAEEQPEIATGKDLRGPPEKLAPSKTPE